ncbi:hypothetical protein [Lentibacillus saliphilus]|uniref:hypothetical protein n=1 Tax=Lentibacillus saliphilus TaxID=2737028 RepID=UPI001C2F760C|nr:hypothetical protein [Lentibacillus saliphilus]
MRKSYVCLFVIIVFLLMTTTSCSESKSENTLPTISIAQDSNYEKTFDDLGLGILFDFNFYLPQADKRVVKLSVEKYENGRKASEPVAQLVYGNSLNEVDEGRLGFGMLNTDSEDMLSVLYSPHVSQIDAMNVSSDRPRASAWYYAFGEEEEIKLTLGEPQLLAAYRETEKSVIKIVDLQDEASVQQMIKDHDLVLLLKLTVKEGEISVD